MYTLCIALAYVTVDVHVVRCIGSCDSAQVHTLCVALAPVTVDVHVVHCIGLCDSRCTRCALHWLM